jgi:hypothetical protein
MIRIFANRSLTRYGLFVMADPEELPEEMRQYLASIGRRGGAAKSDKKAAASRANGKKGGRPRKQKDVPRGTEPTTV